METVDYVVLFGYFAGMAAIGVWAMKRVNGQEDYFMGGRRFGKLFQTFAACGAGTGSADPVNTARGTFANGMSGMWGVMYWLFVTPIYWISAVWYRRMRCLTLGDWFVERYQSEKMGVAYALFGCFYYMVYGAMLFTAIGKVSVPLVGCPRKKATKMPTNSRIRKTTSSLTEVLRKPSSPSRSSSRLRLELRK